MSLHKEIEKLKWDKRLIDWYVSRGKLKKEEVQAYLQSLPDSASNVETFSLSVEAMDEMNGHDTSGGGFQS